jgi:hypothetical protein
VALAEHEAIALGPVGFAGAVPQLVVVERDDEVSGGQGAAEVVELARAHRFDELKADLGGALFELAC